MVGRSFAGDFAVCDCHFHFGSLAILIVGEPLAITDSGFKALYRFESAIRPETWNVPSGLPFLKQWSCTVVHWDASNSILPSMTPLTYLPFAELLAIRIVFDVFTIVFISVVGEDGDFSFNANLTVVIFRLDLLSARSRASGSLTGSSR